MPLINCETTLDLNWTEKCVIVVTNLAVPATAFSITNTKLYVSVVALSAQHNAKLLQQLKSSFKRAINWNNKYQTKKLTGKQNQYLDFLINPSFQGINRLFLLSLENEVQRASYKRYYLPTREVKVHNVMIDGENFFNQPVRNNLIIYDNVWKIATDQENDYATGCFVDYNYFKKYCKMIEIDLIKQQAFGTDPKTIQQINYWKSRESINNIFHYQGSETKCF